MGLKTYIKSSWENYLMRRMGARGSLEGWPEEQTYQNKGDYLSAMERVGWVYDCVTCIMDNFIRPRWWFEKGIGKKKTKEIDIPDLARLLTRPTPYYTGNELFRATIAYMLLVGEAYWFLADIDALSTLETRRNAKGEMEVVIKEGRPVFKTEGEGTAFLRSGKPTAIWYLRPDCITVVPGKDGKLIDHYLYRPNRDREFKIPPEQMIYFRRFDPLSMTEGLGVIEAIRQSLDIEQYARGYNRRFFKNSARPDGAIVAKGTLTKPQMELYSAEWNSRFQGTTNQHKWAVLGNDADLKVLSMTAKDMDFIEQLKFTREDILSAFRVPPSKIGIFQANALGNSNVKEQDNIFWAECMEPHMRDFSDKVTAELVSRWNPEAIFAFEDMTPDDLLLQSQIAKNFIETGIWSPNQAIEQQGLGDTYEGGDQHYISAMLVPVGEDRLAALQARQPQQPTEGGQQPTEDEGEGNEQDGDGEEVTQGDASAEEGKARVIKASEGCPCGQHEKRLPAGILRNGKHYHKSLPQSDRILTQRKFRAAALREFQRQEREVMGNADSVLADYAAKQKRIEPERQVIEQLVNELGNWEELAKEFRKAMRAEYVNALQLAGEISLADLGVDVIFNVEHPAVLSWLADYIPILEDAVTTTTQGALSAAIRTAIENDASLIDLKDAVREVFREAKRTRAETIAITEGNRSLNEGELQGWRQSMVVVAKQWVLGPDPCDFCLDMADRVEELNTEFYSVGDSQILESEDMLEMDYFGVDGPPLHLRCVCQLMPILLEAQ